MTHAYCLAFRWDLLYTSSTAGVCLEQFSHLTRQKFSPCSKRCTTWDFIRNSEQYT